LKFDNSRKDRAVTDLGIDHKRRTLVYLERVKFSRRRANPLFDFRRSRALHQFSGIDTTRFSADLSRNIPGTDFSPFTQRRMSQSKPNAIIRKTKVLGRFGHAIRRKPLRQARIVPVRIEHKWRTHHHSAAAIEPLLLLARSRQTTRIHQRDLPLKLGAAVVSLLVLARSWRPSAPHRGWRIAALVVLAITGMGWLFGRGAAGYIGGSAWFVLLFLPAIGLRKMNDLAAQRNYRSARKLGVVLQILHPTSEMRSQVQLLRQLESQANH